MLPLLKLLSDVQFIVPALEEAEAKAAKGWPVHLYLINYMNPSIKLPVQGFIIIYELEKISFLFCIYRRDINHSFCIDSRQTLMM